MRRLGGYVTPAETWADAAAILGLMRLPRIGAVAIHRILDTLAAIDTAPRYLLEYDAADLVADGMMTEAQAALYRSEDERAWRTLMLDRLDAASVCPLPITADTYPEQLRSFLGATAPPLLMARGDLAPLLPGSIAFAGARRASEAGLAHTRALVAGAAAQRLTVVSGGARGTDMATHEEALERGGSTVIVLAEGILTPTATQFDPMLAHGDATVVSTFPPLDGWAAWRAMDRNRTILGLGERLVVIEAGARGGTLAAGREAMEAGMETWVLDYEDPPASAAGNRLLLEMGARPISVAADGELTIPPEVFALAGCIVIEIPIGTDG